MRVGYATGVFDLFHVGHLRFLRNASALCNRLIVGVSTDELACYKGRKPVIPEEQRMEILRGVKGVDAVVPQRDLDKVLAHDQLKFDVLFVGGWFGDERWKEYERVLKSRGVDVVYFPYTDLVSSTKIIETIRGE